MATVGSSKKWFEILVRRGFSTSSRRCLRLLQYEQGHQKKLGVEVGPGGDVISLSDHEDFPNEARSFLQGGSDLMNLAKKYVESGAPKLPRSAIRLLAPITEPRKIICVGMNYRDHCKETNTPLPDVPLIFNKFPTTIIGHGDSIVIPKVSNAVDWEVELAIVIGERGKNLEIEDASAHIAGYTVALDVSARDWFGDKNGGQWILGKSFDTFCPIGPVIVTSDEIPDPNNMKISCRVNDKVMQDSCTDQLIFSTNHCVSWASQFCTLEPGDLILTGTPPGVGACRDPPIFFKSGDVVTCEIQGIGQISNPVV